MNTSLRLTSACVVLVLLVAQLAAVSSSAESPSKAKENDQESSVSQIQASLKREPRNAKLYIKLGQAYWKGGDYPKAFDAFRQSVKLAPASGEAHNWLGAFLMGRGNLPDAISRS